MKPVAALQAKYISIGEELGISYSNTSSAKDAAKALHESWYLEVSFNLFIFVKI